MFTFLSTISTSTPSTLTPSRTLSCAPAAMPSSFALSSFDRKPSFSVVARMSLPSITAQRASSALILPASSSALEA